MERRKNQRVKRRFSVTINGNAAIVNNLSKDGMQLLMTVVPPERNVNVHFQIGDQVFDLKGVVLWIKKQVSIYKQYQVGISLTNATYEYYQLIDKPL